MPRKLMRSPLARAGGLGSAKAGVEHWWRQRLSAVALIPLTLWFIVATVMHGGNNYIAYITWMKGPFSTLMMILLLTAVFHHTALGLQVIIEDYIHSVAKLPLLAMMQLCCVLLAAIGFIAVVHVAILS